MSPSTLCAGRSTHALTAASAAQLVTALLEPEPRPLHAPALPGRPGGYPILASSAGAELDLPAGLTEAEAIAVNEAGGRADGIERVTGDGTIVYTSGERIAASDLDAAAESLRERQAALRGG